MYYLYFIDERQVRRNLPTFTYLRSSRAGIQVQALELITISEYCSLATLFPILKVLASSRLPTKTKTLEHGIQIVSDYFLPLIYYLLRCTLQAANVVVVQPRVQRARKQGETPVVYPMGNLTGLKPKGPATTLMADAIEGEESTTDRGN